MGWGGGSFLKVLLSSGVPFEGAVMVAARYFSTFVVASGAQY